MSTSSDDVHRKPQSVLNKLGRHANGRPKPKTSTKIVQATERQTQCLELKLKGLTTGQIAKQLGITQATAWHHTRKALEKAKKINELAIEDLRCLESDRLDCMQYALWPQASKGHLGAIDRILKIMQRRAQLWGLDKQPDTQVQAVQINISTGQSQVVEAKAEKVAEVLQQSNNSHDKD